MLYVTTLRNAISNLFLSVYVFLCVCLSLSFSLCKRRLLFFTRENPLVAQKLRQGIKLFGSAPYSGRSSSMKPLCSRTVLNRCTATAIRWNKNEEAQTSPVVSTNRLPNTRKNWIASLLICAPLAQSQRLIITIFWLHICLCLIIINIIISIIIKVIYCPPYYEPERPGITKSMKME